MSLPKKILVVDDEPSILFTLTHLFNIHGVEVIACNEIEQAEAALATTPFDLVIADIRMSGVDGIEGLELLSYVKQHYAIPVIIMTGFSSREIEEEAQQRGVHYFLHKPVELKALLSSVATLGIPVRQ
ncbi:MAG: response regulator [Desulfuromonadales bacterium]|nr:response regulator [Desulfuromonadales bacterium]